MKKLFIALGIVIILIVGTFGSVVMAAAPEPKPVEAWNLIVEQVDEITGILFELGDNVSAVDGKVDDIKDSTDQILVTEMIEDDLYAGGDYLSYDSDSIGEPDGPIMHVSVTVWKNGVLTYLGDPPTPPTSVVDGSIRITVEPNDEETPRQVAILRHDDFHDSQWKAFTYEFNARQWHISSDACWFDAETQPLNVHYVATMSYHPEE